VPPTDDEVFGMIAEERRALADLLDTLTPEQWATPSLCAGWTVREVAAHLVVPFEVSVPSLMLRLVRSLGSYDRAMDGATREVAARPTTELAARLRANADHRFTPPMSGPEAPLTDVVVHGQDIRRPLGIAHGIEPEHLRVALDRMAGGALGFVPRSRVAGLRFEATDLDWSAGDGALVRGPAEAILLAITGRPVALADLEGDGADRLADRIG
jgi:uncharacterized protein (TIGR03083 family)